MCPALQMGFLWGHSECLDPFHQLAVSTMAVALCPGRQTQQHSTLLRGTPGNPDRCFFPASPSCLREHL